MDELRKPPPGWEDLVGPQEEKHVERVPPELKRNKPCNKFNSEVGCPYGDRCLFIHERLPSQPQPQAPAPQPAAAPPPQRGPLGNGGGAGEWAGRSGPLPQAPVEARGPPGGGGADNSSGVGGGIGGVGGGSGVSDKGPRPAHWKTRICLKWEEGACPFGDKCHFAHGAHDLQPYGGSAAVSAGGNATLRPDTVEAAAAPRQPNGKSGGGGPAAHARPEEAGGGGRGAAAWHGPAGQVTTVYGDWLAEEDWEEEDWGDTDAWGWDDEGGDGGIVEDGQAAGDKIEGPAEGSAPGAARPFLCAPTDVAAASAVAQTS
eukprot:SM000020S05990  [mRNA]  locus=s20:358607:360182:+ [translate_table: standard]